MIVDLSNEWITQVDEDEIFDIWNEFYPNSKDITGYLSDDPLPHIDYKFILKKTTENNGIYDIYNPVSRTEKHVRICNTWLRSRFGMIPQKLWYYEQGKWHDIIQMQNNAPVVVIHCGELHRFSGRNRYVAHIHLCLHAEHYILKKPWGNSGDYGVDVIKGKKYYRADHKKVDASSPESLRKKIDSEIGFLRENVVQVLDSDELYEESPVFHILILNRAAEIIRGVK